MPKAVRIAAVAALAAGVGVFLNWHGNLHDFFDLRIYMSAMRWWADGNPLYDYAQPDRVQGELYFTYPPFAAVLLRPFAEIPVNATIVIFTIGTAVAIAVTSWWLVSPVADRYRQPRWFAAGLAIPLVFAIEPTRETITFGQINMLLVVLILGDLLILVPRSSRWAGVGIGLATALKLYPGIFIVYLLAARRWRAAITASAAAAAATLVAAAIAPRDSWRFWTHELWATDRVGRTDYTGNQSLLGLLGRLSTPDEPSRLLWLALVALAAGYGLWRAARAVRAGDEVAGLALTGLVGALVSPITWTHHVYWFVPALVVLVDAGLRGPGASRPFPGPRASGASASQHGPGAGDVRSEERSDEDGRSRPFPGPRGSGASASQHGPGAGDVRSEERSDEDGRSRPFPGPRGSGASASQQGPGRRQRFALLALAMIGYAVLVRGVVSFDDWGVAPEPTDSVTEFLRRNAYVLLTLVLIAVLPARSGVLDYRRRGPKWTDLPSHAGVG